MQPAQIPAPAEQIDVTNPHDLVKAVRLERQRRGLSCDAVDQMAGLSDRYMNKLENYGSNSGRGLGFFSLPQVLRALGFRLVLVREPRADQSAGQSAGR